MSRDTATFFSSGSSEQYEYVLGLYPAVLKIKAERKNKKPLELIKLDEWYQNELPIKIKSRGKDAHVTHDELVQTMKWKLARGKFYPQLSNLVKINTPKAVLAESRKAFRKLPNLESAITALNNLKGVGTTMASAILAAACPDRAPFMADECLMAIPEIEGIDYTTKEYLNFVNHIRTTVDRLNRSTASAAGAKNSTSPAASDALPAEGGSSGSPQWSAHKVELALWTHFVASELKPSILENMPGNNAAAPLRSLSMPSDEEEEEDASVLTSAASENGDLHIPVAATKNGQQSPAKKLHPATEVLEESDSTSDSVPGAPAATTATPAPAAVIAASKPVAAKVSSTTSSPSHPPPAPHMTADTDDSSSLGISEESSSRGAALDDEDEDEEDMVDEDDEDMDMGPVPKKTRLMPGVGNKKKLQPIKAPPPPVTHDDNALQA